MIIERINEQLPGTILERHAFRGDETATKKEEFVHAFD